MNVNLNIILIRPKNELRIGLTLGTHILKNKFKKYTQKKNFFFLFLIIKNNCLKHKWVIIIVKKSVTFVR